MCLDELKSRITGAWMCLTKRNVVVLHSKTMERQKFILISFHPVAAYCAALGFIDRIKPICNKISQKKFKVDITELVEVTTSEE